MNFLHWMQAYATVYYRRLCNLNRAAVMYLVALIVAVLLALVLGPLGMLALLLVVLFVLPIINIDVKKEIDEEYNRRSK